MLNRIIERPVLATAISIIIVALGIVGLINLPVSQFPDIAPSIIRVRATYSGANAETVLNSVLMPLEEQINGVENMAYMSSTAANDGTATISIYFKVGTDADMAAVNVQNRVSMATNVLPPEVLQSGVQVSKRQSSDLLIFSLYSEDAQLSNTFIENYALINLVPLLKRINGVGDINVFGQRDYAMRIWLKPDAMASYQLMPSDIVDALADQNIDAAPGKFGEQSGQTQEYMMRYSGRLRTVEDFGNIVLKSLGPGKWLNLKDVAEIEQGAMSYARQAESNGAPAAGISISQVAGSNANEIIVEAKELLEEAALNFPSGLRMHILYDANDFLGASISSVKHTFIEAFILVFLVVFLFLQDWRATLVPLIAVPVSVIGTFFLLLLFGFTLNLLTLFALVLAIGIVVDDAIIIVEAIHLQMKESNKSALVAAQDALKDILGPIISVTVIMAAVFLPVTFLDGTAGLFYRQFGLTLAIAILISAVNALTLSPALTALLFRRRNGHGTRQKSAGKLQRFLGSFERGFERLKSSFEVFLREAMSRKIGMMALLLTSFAGLWVCFRYVPSSFVPNEDQGTIYINIQLPPASTLERTALVADQVDSIVGRHPAVEASLRTIGESYSAGRGSAYAMVMVRLLPWAERKSYDLDRVVGDLRQTLSSVKGGEVELTVPPTIQGFGQSGGLEIQLQDRTGGSLQALKKVSDEFLKALNESDVIERMSTSFDPSYPQYEVKVNVQKVKAAGLQVKDIMGTLEGYFGVHYASNFNQFGKPYRVLIQARSDYRSDKNGLSRIYVRNSQEQMAPIGEFVDLKLINSAEIISRFNLFSTVGIKGMPAQGYSSGDAIKEIAKIAREVLPRGYSYEFSGITREEISSGNQLTLVLLVSIFFVYILLSAQFESYIVPIAVLMPISFGLLGSFLFSAAIGMGNNIYLQITMIMLIGLLCKNNLLMVKYALKRYQSGMGLLDAAVKGATERFRPVVMTSLAFILGVLPLAISQGIGAQANHAIGYGAIGGMLTGTFFGFIFTPFLLYIVCSFEQRLKKQDYHEKDNSAKTYK